MDQSLFRRDEIWFAERDADNASRIYSLDLRKDMTRSLAKPILKGDMALFLCSGSTRSESLKNKASVLSCGASELADRLFSQTVQKQKL